MREFLLRRRMAQAAALTLGTNVWPAATLAQTTEPFAQVLPGTALTFPADHGAHPKFRTEWWYLTGQAKTRDEIVGFQITFFRSRTTHSTSNTSRFSPSQLLVAHIALALPSAGKLIHEERAGRASAGAFDGRFSEEDCRLELRGWKLMREGSDYLIFARGEKLSLQLRLSATNPVQLQGTDGFSQKGPLPAQASHYYSQPQLSVKGQFIYRDERNMLKQLSIAPSDEPGVNQAWLDHEWSSTLLDPNAVGWDWVGLNLANGESLMAFRLRDRAGQNVWSHWVRRDAQGLAIEQGNSPNAVQFKTLDTWISPRTQTKYPVRQEIRFGSTWIICTPLFPDQELDSRASTGNVYWEGAIHVQGASPTQTLVGRGYLELTGYTNPIKI
jgi:predicted secreted hydrolase